MTKNPPPPQPLSYWLDAFFTLTELTVEMVQDIDGLANRLGVPKEKARSMVSPLNMENLHHRRQVWRNVKAAFGRFGEGIYPTEIFFRNMTTGPMGTMAIEKLPVMIYAKDDKTPVSVNTEDEAVVVARFFQFYRQYAFTLEPDRFVRQSLEAAGITKDNFLTHPKSPSGMINNPFAKELE
jgi:hypothetical protein